MNSRFFSSPVNRDDLEQNRKGLSIISFGLRLQDFDIQVPKLNNEIAPRNKMLTSFSLANHITGILYRRTRYAKMAIVSQITAIFSFKHAVFVRFSPQTG